MSDHEAYRILTREWTNMHASERDILDRAGWKYLSALELTKQGRREEAVEIVTAMITDKGQTWRAKQDKKFIN